MEIRNCSPLYVRNRHDYYAVLHAWHCIVNGGWDSETAIPWAAERFDADESVVRSHWRAIAAQGRWKNGKYDHEPVHYALVAIYGV